MDNDKRKLTAKELKRKNDFEKLNSEMQQKGYKIKNMTINIRQANFLGPLSMLPFIALTFLFYYNVNGFDLGGISLRFVVAAFLLLPLTILHELIHGITWGFLRKIIFIRLILDLFGVVFLHTVLALNRWKSGNICWELLCLH